MDGYDLNFEGYWEGVRDVAGSFCVGVAAGIVATFLEKGIIALLARKK